MAVLDLPALLRPIPGDDPGGPHPSQIREKDPNRDPTNLDKLRREAKALPVEDPARTKLYRDGMKLAQELFASRCKNLDWAIYAADTASRCGGIAGVRDAFKFLRQLVEQGWGWVWPRVNQAEIDRAEPEERESLRKELEMNAAEARSGRFNSLDDAEGGLLFPNVLREWVIAEQDGVQVSVFNSRGSDNRPAKVSPEDAQALARKLGSEPLKATLTEIDGALADLEALRAAVEGKFVEIAAPDLAPSFREVRLALEDCRQVADEMYAAVEGEIAPAAEVSAEAGSSAAPAATEKVTRAALYKQIGQIADHLTRIEPHSPVPFMLRRVVELQDLPFPQLVREFTKSSETVLSFLERSLKAGQGEE
jgi:type VI secretion system protein ImpA